jgi:type IV secretory pathway TraG/TraD family ATPase VirD4
MRGSRPRSCGRRIPRYAIGRWGIRSADFQRAQRVKQLFGKSDREREERRDGASEKGRRLLTQDEVLGMPNEKQLLQVAGHRPVYANKLSYLDKPEVRGLYPPNPIYS